ncbi:hypothetical protein BH11PSE8_BH11PSE8_18770 [soil metagenome]
MASDADWVEDVRRWYFSGAQNANPPVIAADDEADSEPMELGYEAAHPALQARHWPDAPRR